MNGFIVALCMTLLTLVNAGHNINLETILKILKDKPRKSGLPNNDETSDLGEVIPIMPGFYFEKPKELSESLFKNPTALADDIDAILSKEEATNNIPEVNVNTETKTSDDVYFQRKLLKAVEDLKKIRENQKLINDTFKKIKTYVECNDDLIHKRSNAFKAHIHTEIDQNEPVKRPLGRVFQGVNGGKDLKGKERDKKLKNDDGSSNNKILGDLLKKIIGGNVNNQQYEEKEQHAYRYAKTEEEIHSKEELLGNILNTIQNNNPRPESEIDLRPSMVLISSASLDNADYEEENNAKEETSAEDNIPEPLELYNTRRHEVHHVLESRRDSDESDSSSASDSSDYERNPGNPYTVHKNKYKQNWPYNHYMDGDHMNINPFGPQFGSLGPTGPELFFGRKWWYFNQDDFKPMG